MKTQLLFKKIVFVLIIISGLLHTNAQVGINTTSPSPGSMLDIESTTKGMLVPRVDIANLNTIAPITGGATESLLVYNTNTTTGRGFHYWDGTIWIAISSSKDWKLNGNLGTNPGTGIGQDYLGTGDSRDLLIATNASERFRVTANGNILASSSGSLTDPIFAWTSDSDNGFYRPGNDQFGLITNGIERLRIPNTNQIHAMARGNNGAPFYSWDEDTDTGIWRAGNDRLNISVGQREMVEFRENNNNSFIVFNDGGNITNFRIETDNQQNAFYVNGTNDNIGLGTNTPDTSAQLEISDTDKGILINRIALTATNIANPVNSPATGLLIYNTASSGTGNTEVLPGFYYWDGIRWVAMGGTNGRDWSLDGNAGTNDAINFLGTTDATGLIFRTDNTQRMSIASAGTVGIGNLPFTDVALRVNNPAHDIGIISQTNGTGISIIGEDASSGIGVLGESQGGWGVQGITSANNNAVSGGVLSLGLGTNNISGMWSVAINYPTNSVAQNIGVRAVSGSGTSISPVGYPTIGLNTNAIELGLYSLSEGPLVNYNEIQSALFKTNFAGPTDDADSRDPGASLAGFTNNSLQGAGNMYYGGYFYSGSNNPSYAYAGARFNGTRYKIIGNGAVSTIVDGIDKNDSKRVMFAPEAPEVLFEDYGTGKLTNGVAIIKIDPILSKNILVDKSHPLKVFIQLEGDCNGVYVAEKTIDGFKVKELQNGISNVSFSWHIVANRKDTEGNNTNAGSKYSDLRFPNAPNELNIKPNNQTKFKQITRNEYNEVTTNH